MADMSPGRELAIETLIDMEPEGAFYRAGRVLVRRIVRTGHDEVSYNAHLYLFCL